MTTLTFPERPRFDARDKVLGATVFCADFPFPRLAHAMLVPSRITKGTLTAIDTTAALNVPGVLQVLTPDDFPPLPPFNPAAGLPPPIPTLKRTISFSGEPIAIVVAETLEAAIEGAEAVNATYAPEPFAAVIDAPGSVRLPATPTPNFGDATTALAGAAVTVDENYISLTQHNNPMELISTTAVFANGRLIIYEGSQNVSAARTQVATVLGLDPTTIDVKSSYVGGSFGQKSSFGQRQTALVAWAALKLGRPVKLVTPRSQLFHITTYRPLNRHRIRLGATAAGKMVALQHDADQEQSRTGVFYPASGYFDHTCRHYGISNFGSTAADVRIDRGNPGFMRGPFEHPSSFALESAVDELSYMLGIDPVTLRLNNDTQIDPPTGQPFSSRFLKECLQQGARQFGWAQRNPVPGSMRAADGTQIGWGVATGGYHVNMVPALATLQINANGTARYAASGHDMGQGLRTTIAAVLIGGLNIDPNRLEIDIGDTTVAPQALTAGSTGTGNAVPVAINAVAQMKAAIADLLGGRTIPGTISQQLAALRRPSIQVQATYLPPGLGADALAKLQSGIPTFVGEVYQGFTTLSYSAHFVEVRVEPRTRRIRVPRVVSFVDCGQVISPRTARSQILGSAVWGISHALRESTDVDPRYGAYLNSDLADYIVPVNADIGSVQVGFINKPDPLVNPVGLKCLGEISFVGAAAAVVNAVYHATGKRLRQIPIHLEDLL